MINYIIIGFIAVLVLIAGISLRFFIGAKRKIKKTTTPPPPPPITPTSNDLILNISKEFKEQILILIRQELQKNRYQFENRLAETSNEIVELYKKSFEKAQVETKQLIDNISQKASQEISRLSNVIANLENKIAQEGENKISEINLTAQKEISKIQQINLTIQDKLTRDLEQNLGQIYKSLSETLNKKITETEQQIEEYKQNKFKEIDKKIYKMVSAIAKTTINQALDLSTHEKLVMEALEKAKKEIF